MLSLVWILKWSHDAKNNIEVSVLFFKTFSFFALVYYAQKTIYKYNWVIVYILYYWATFLTFSHFSDIQLSGGLLTYLLSGYNVLLCHQPLSIKACLPTYTCSICLSLLYLFCCHFPSQYNPFCSMTYSLISA